jgi:molybdopterin molybdotransferase
VLSLDEARSLLARAVEPLAPVRVDLRDAIGHRLAAAISSDVDVPPADVSAMDGYAVRYADLASGSALPVAVEVAAGNGALELPPRAAARIFTGALLPAGADTVVPQERARLDKDKTVILESCDRGAHVRAGGEVLTAGAEVFTAGSWVTPQMASVMAACGASRVEVVPRPVIAVVVNGAEIVDISATPGPGQIRDSNGPLLAALTVAAGLEVAVAVRAPDSRPLLREAVKRALREADLVLTTGGVSVGEHDLVPDVVADLGGEILLHRVRIKPGKPLLAARVGSKLLIGLPGNPLAVLVGWRCFAWPAAAALAGDEGAFSERPVDARLCASLSAPKGRTELRPSVLRSGDDGAEVEVLGWKGSHDVSASARANALARLEPGRVHPAGSRVPCYPLPAADPRPEGVWRSSS